MVCIVNSVDLLRYRRCILVVLGFLVDLILGLASIVSVGVLAVLTG